MLQNIRIKIDVSCQHRHVKPQFAIVGIASIFFFADASVFLFIHPKNNYSVVQIFRHESLPGNPYGRLIACVDRSQLSNYWSMFGNNDRSSSSSSFDFFRWIIDSNLWYITPWPIWGSSKTSWTHRASSKIIHYRYEYILIFLSITGKHLMGGWKGTNLCRSSAECS